MESKLLQPLNDEFDIVCVVSGPQDFGEPHLRARFHACGVNRRTCKWIGPPPPRVQEDFNRRFNRAVVMHGDAFLIASPSEYLAELKRLAALQGTRNLPDHYFASLGSAELIRAVMPAGAVNIWEAWMQEPLATQCFDAGQPFLCDLQQRPESASAGGPDYPSQLTHGTIVANFGDGRPPRVATALEACQAMGFNLLSDAIPKSTLAPVLRGLPPGRLQKLCGNGMQLTVEAAWMLYCVMNVVRQDNRLPRS